MASGDLETAGGTPRVALAYAIERGIPIKMVADKGLATGFEFVQVVVLSDCGAARCATSPTCGVGGSRWASLRSGAESLVAHVLARGGVGIGEVDLTPLSLPDMVVALSNRAIDGANMTGPAQSAAIERGVAATWEPGRSSAAFGGVYQAAEVVISGQFAAQTDLARAFLIAYLRGVRGYNDAFVKGEGRAEIVQILTENTSVKDPAAYDRMAMAALDPDGRIVRPSLQLDMDYSGRWATTAAPSPSTTSSTPPTRCRRCSSSARTASARRRWSAVRKSFRRGGGFSHTMGAARETGPRAA